MKLIGHMLFGGAMLMNNVMATEIESKSANIHMRYINIAPMFMDHKTEVCKDIAQLYKQGIITENAFMMKLNPQGTPPVDLVTEAAKNFTEMRTELRKYSDVPQGILVQASIGHGYWQDTPPEDFTCMETIAPEQNNSLKYIVCPYDDDFRTYFKDMARKLSQLKPDFLLIDDDYRIITGRFGCFCPLHIAGYNKKSGKNYTRETLSDAIRKDRKTALDYEQFLGETFSEALSDFRAEFSKLAPEVNIYYCSCTMDLKFTAEFARRLVASGTKPVIRLNNGRYSKETMREFPLRMYTTRAMIDYLNREGEFELLSEADTHPKNQYFTSAALLNCHMAGSIAEGVAGAKHWITSLSGHEPESGKAYRAILATYSGFYQELAKLQRQKRDLALTMATPGKKFLENSVFWKEFVDAQVEFVVAMARLGLPANYAPAGKNVSVLNVEFIDFWSDDEIREILKNGAIIEGEAALRLAERGFAEALGVDVVKGVSAKATVERLADGRRVAALSSNLVTLKPRSEQTKTLSTLYTKVGKGTKSELVAVTPGMTRFKNVLIFAGTPFRHIYWPNFTAFLNGTRKEIVLSQVRDMVELPAVYSGPDDIYTKLWQVGDQVVMPIITLGRDDMPELELTVSKMPTKIESLQPSGKWASVPFRRESPEKIVIEQEFRATRPFVLKFSY